MENNPKKRTVAEAGWHRSKYITAAAMPETDKIGVLNLYKLSFSVYSPAEMYLLSVVEDLDEDHPVLERFRKRGLIVNFDEKERLREMGSSDFRAEGTVFITICPTMACNMDCIYCWEKHQGTNMTRKTQDDVIRLAGKMLDTFKYKDFEVTWFGGEPLLAPEIIDDMSGRLMKLAEEKGVDYRACIYTNGYFLTQEIVDMLHRNKVKMLITNLEGTKEVHDKYRPVVAGGSSYEKVVQNLRELKMPFPVTVRNVLHAGNLGDRGKVEELVKELAEESGNTLLLEPDRAYRFKHSESDETLFMTLDGEDAAEVGLVRDQYFARGASRKCERQTLSSVEIDEQGRLFKCKGGFDCPEMSFGTADTWDPADPYKTALEPDILKGYFFDYFEDEECTDCIWVTLCEGGCPHLRQFYKRECVLFKNDPEKYIRKLYYRWAKENEKYIQEKKCREKNV